MDSFNLLIGILLVFIAFQLQQTWIVFLIVAILIITMHSVMGSIILIAVSGLLYLFAASGSLKEYSLPIIAVLIVVALLSGLKKQPEQQDLFGGGMDPYAGLGGGGFEGGGMGGGY
jgi:hypothetical protein